VAKTHSAENASAPSAGQRKEKRGVFFAFELEKQEKRTNGKDGMVESHKPNHSVRKSVETEKKEDKVHGIKGRVPEVGKIG
jgi:hypothetical protein